MALYVGLNGGFEKVTFVYIVRCCPVNVLEVKRKRQDASSEVEPAISFKGGSGTLTKFYRYLLQLF